MKAKCFGIAYRIVVAAVLVSLLAFGNPGRASAGSIIYVNQGATGLNNGTSWAAAYTNLQDALAAANSGDQIWVAKGIYKPTSGLDRTISFKLKDGVAIYGGFTGIETQLSERRRQINTTILSGDIGVAGDTTDNSYHVLFGRDVSSATILDGFTIAGGSASGASFPDNSGGGLYLVNYASSPTLENLMFRDNSATGGENLFAGGGAIALNGSSPTLHHVAFHDNSAGSGGAMLIADGFATMTDVVFHGNTALRAGGALFVDGGGFDWTDGTFSSNSAGQEGGAMFTLNGAVYTTFANVTFHDNSAMRGGAIYAAEFDGAIRMANITFHGNSATTGGAMFVNSENSDTELTHVTFNANSAMSGGAIYWLYGRPVRIANSVLWGDGTELAINTSNNPDVTGHTMFAITGSVVQGGCPTLIGGSCPDGVITTDPVLGPLQNNGGLTDTMALGAGSSAIDAGDPSSCGESDQRGIARPQGPGCDAGAYEVRATASASIAEYDGYIRESSKGSERGGPRNSRDSVLQVGDDRLDRSYHGILSFNLSAPPEGATTILAKVGLLERGRVGDPFATQGTLVADLAAPYFGKGPLLAGSDYQAAAMSPATNAFSLTRTGWYSAVLTDSAFSAAMKTGGVQLRLRFTGEKYNGLADYLMLYSGDEEAAAYQPVLWVYYNP